MTTMTGVTTGLNFSRRSDDPQREHDELRLQLLGAIDAARGAEAERAVFEARVRELEHQHHMLVVERDELRREIDRLSGQGRTRRGRRLGRLARSAKRRLLDG